MNRIAALPSFLLVLATFTAPSYASGQDVSTFAYGKRTPRFLYAANTSAEPVDIDPRTAPVLRDRISVGFDDVSLREALEIISRKSGLRLFYSKDVVALDTRVRLRAEDITVAAALTEVLFDAGMDVLLGPNGQAAIVERKAVALEEPPQGTIVGRVTDTESGNPLMNAQIAVDGRGRTITDADGRYRVEGVPVGSHTVSVTLIGYASVTQEVEVAEGVTVTVDFALNVAPSTLDELVVTATGEQRRVELGHALGNIRADAIARTAPIANFSDLLQSRVAGVTVLTPDGGSGLSSQIRIRGMNSFTLANDPIVVIDGVRVENTPAQRSNPTLFNFTSRHTTGRLADINPREIESIEIVKGPSAATLYGTDAANGVILINTKRGTPGRTAVNIYTEIGAIDPDQRYPDTWYRFGRSTESGAPLRCTLLAEAAKSCMADSLSHFNPMTNPATTPLGTGVRQVYGAQLSGGLPSLTYFLSGEYESERGFLRMPDIDQERYRAFLGRRDIPAEIVHPNGVRKVSLRGSMTGSLADRGDLRLSVGFVNNDTRVAGAALPRSAQFGPGYRDEFDGWFPRLRPSDLFGERNRERTSHFTGSLSSTFLASSWLSLRGTVGLDYSGSYFDYLVRRGEGSGIGTVLLGRRANARTETTLHSADLSGTATFDLGNGFSSRTTLGGQYNRRVHLETLAFGQGLAPGSETVAGASLLRGGEQTLETIVAGGFVEQQVSFADRLFITLAGRVDGASSFGRDFDAAFYPKANLSWLAIDDTGEAQAFLSSLRLRTAYGLSGVQPDPLASLQRFELASALVDGVAAPGARLLTLGNPDLRPERQSELEAGIDIELDDGRVYVELTGYHRQSEGALVAVPFDPSFAIASQQQNVGAVRNQGVEGLLRARLVDQQSWSVEVNLNGSYNDNKLLKLAPSVAGSGSLWRQVPDYPLFGFWARPVLSYDDADGNGIIEPAEVVVGDSDVFAGSSIPTTDLVAGTTVTLARGAISLSGLINYRGGYKTYNEAVWLACLVDASCRAMNDPTTPLREQAYAVAYTTGSLGNTSWGLIEDASHWRLRELSFTYNASASVARVLGARTASLTLAGRNLALFTNYSGIDPEVTANVGSASQSGGPQYPLSTYWIARVNLGF